jgi:hypothetical protein
LCFHFTNGGVRQCLYTVVRHSAEEYALRARAGSHRSLGHLHPGWGLASPVFHVSAVSESLFVSFIMENGCSMSNFENFQNRLLKILKIDLGISQFLSCLT